MTELANATGARLRKRWTFFDEEYTRLMIKILKKLTEYSSLQTCLTATGTHVPNGITQCYLPPGKYDIPAFTPVN